MKRQLGISQDGLSRIAKTVKAQESDWEKYRPLLGKEFSVGVTYQHWDEEAVEAGDTDEKGWELEKEMMDIDVLLQTAQEYGIAGQKSFGGSDGWWSSIDPPQDRDFFEKGIRKNYDFFVDNADGSDIDAATFALIDELIEKGVSDLSWEFE